MPKRVSVSQAVGRGVEAVLPPEQQEGQESKPHNALMAETLSSKEAKLQASKDSIKMTIYLDKRHRAKLRRHQAELELNGAQKDLSEIIRDLIDDRFPD